MLDYYDALQKLLSHAQPMAKKTTCPLEKASGLILAEELRVQYDAPMFDNSAMDGYALCDIDAGSWQLVGQVAAGDNASLVTLAPGQAVRIFTGAGIPHNTDSVVMQEKTSVNDNVLTLTAPVKAGANIRRQGEELRAGQVLLPANTLISAAAIGLIASQGYAEVPCYQPLNVSLFSTGDELTALGQPLAPNSIYDSNRPMLQSLLNKPAYLQVNHSKALPDDYNVIKENMLAAAKESDILICSGGASVGDKDYVKQVLTELGELQHWKLAIKPGKPFAWGQIGHCKVFLLPGNPVASFVTFLQMAFPAIKRFAGLDLQQAQPQAWRAKADFTISPNKQNRREFFRGTVTAKEDGIWATPFTGQGSHMISSCIGADAIIEVPAETSIEHGQWVTIFPLNRFD